MELEEAKKVILEHINKLITVKNTKWVYDAQIKEYVEVNAGFSEGEIKIMEDSRYRDMKSYFKLRDLLEELI